MSSSFWNDHANLLPAVSFLASPHELRTVLSEHNEAADEQAAG